MNLLKLGLRQIAIDTSVAIEFDLAGTPPNLRLGLPLRSCRLRSSGTSVSGSMIGAPRRVERAKGIPWSAEGW
jgi:hypothetical protein